MNILSFGLYTLFLAPTVALLFSHSAPESIIGFTAMALFLIVTLVGNAVSGKSQHKLSY